jgi:hypothetical protein
MPFDRGLVGALRVLKVSRLTEQIDHRDVAPRFEGMRHLTNGPNYVVTHAD